MSIRLWPKDFERKDHITKAEKGLLRQASRHLDSGHFAVGIDPLGLSNAESHMGMYISPKDGLITYTIYSGNVDASKVDAYLMYVSFVENSIYKRLLDSKLLIVRNGASKVLKFPYKHVIIFPDQKVGRVAASKELIRKMLNYCTYDFFRPITSRGKENKISQFAVFDGIRQPYDPSFSTISDREARAIFERLAPEYTVIMTEKEDVVVEEKKTTGVKKDLTITGKELEYQTFFLDDYQVGLVNDMGGGHRVILANPGAGKSVLLLSKAFKYASTFKDSKVLLTCYNVNLADSYLFKRQCANFGKNRNLYIMNFHKLVYKIYSECLHMHVDSMPTDEDIEKCIELIKAGKVNLKFKAIFIDEVQNFNPLYLELCYLLLENDDDHLCLMAGDLNQSIRAKSRRGDVPWKQMRGINLDFTGRVRYIEKNYRNSKEVSEYIFRMLTYMNKQFEQLGMINKFEYEYNSFTLGEKPALALQIRTGISRMDIKKQIVEAIKEITKNYRVSYSDIAILFPYRQQGYLNYYCLRWIRQGLDEEGIPYSLIISDYGKSDKKKYSETTGVVLSTIESSLGLDFKAVILAGLYPYNFVNQEGKVGKEIRSWAEIAGMKEDEQEAIQSQMRSIYTACSRARDVLYVLSDIKPGSPMEDILKV